MKRLLIFIWGLCAVGLLTLRVLAHDLRLWWTWRREADTPAAVPHEKTASEVPVVNGFYGPKRGISGSHPG